MSQEMEKEFDRAVSEHADKYRQLLHSRGFDPDAFPGVYLPPLEGVSAPASRAAYHESVPAQLELEFAEGTAVLLYGLDRSEGKVPRIWVVDRCGIAAVEILPVGLERLDKAISSLREALGVEAIQASRSPHRGGRPVIPVSPEKTAKVPLDQAIAELTKILLPDTIARSLVSVKHLILVPVLAIGTVPFAILRPFQSDAFLIDRMSVSIAPSLFDLWNRVEKWNPALRAPLVIGNPDFAPADDWVFPPLPGAEGEARAVAKLVHAQALVGRFATKEAVLSKAPAADFLYFATHGVANASDPLRGGFIVLSAREKDKGRWTAEEIQKSSLHAQIAVLSACQTGLGKTHDAGMIGLSRAFQIAGVPRVVMSLWKVNDDATSELMTAFVDNLRSEIPAEALRQAMLKTRQRRPRPSQWASFVLFGIPR